MHRSDSYLYFVSTSTEYGYKYRILVSHTPKSFNIQVLQHSCPRTHCFSEILSSNIHSRSRHSPLLPGVTRVPHLDWFASHFDFQSLHQCISLEHLTRWNISWTVWYHNQVRRTSHFRNLINTRGFGKPTRPHCQWSKVMGGSKLSSELVLVTAEPNTN